MLEIMRTDQMSLKQTGAAPVRGALQQAYMLYDFSISQASGSIVLPLPRPGRYRLAAQLLAAGMTVELALGGAADWQTDTASGGTRVSAGALADTPLLYGSAALARCQLAADIVFEGGVLTVSGTLGGCTASAPVVAIWWAECPDSGGVLTLRAGNGVDITGGWVQLQEVVSEH
ncbi:MAG: hypothetical protein OIF57_19810 [Marinobacterium sp.]|nr:hypothetical protein [Marinobacterium sp.]